MPPWRACLTWLLMTCENSGSGFHIR